MKKIIVVDNNSSFYKKIWLYRIFKLLNFNFEVKFTSNYVDNNEELIKTINILNTKGRKNTYSLIYDYACDVLDKKFCNNLCGFKNNVCISNRNKHSELSSCCEGRDRILCVHFNKKKKKCNIKSISCKLFVCSYLRKKGIKNNVNEVVYLKYFLSIRQKLICYSSFFEDKDQVINKFLKFYKF